MGGEETTALGSIALHFGVQALMAPLLVLLTRRLLAGRSRLFRALLRSVPLAIISTLMIFDFSTTAPSHGPHSPPDSHIWAVIVLGFALLWGIGLLFALIAGSLLERS